MSLKIEINLTDEEQKAMEYFAEDVAVDIQRRISALIMQKINLLIAEYTDKNPDKVTESGKKSLIKSISIPKFKAR